MYSQLPNTTSSTDELQPHLARLADEMQSLDELLAGDALAHVLRPEALSAVGRVQECLDMVAKTLRAPLADSLQPNRLRLADRQDVRVVTRRQVGEIARSLHTVREDVQRDAALLKVLVHSRSWRLTRPVRFVLELMRNPGLLRETMKRNLRFGGGQQAPARQLQAGVDVSVELSPSSPDQALVEVELGLLRLVLPAPYPDKSDIYLWGVIDWHFRYQRPQHLASVLAARGHRVFYVSNHFIDRPYPGFTLEPLDRQGRLHQVHLYLTGRPQIYSQAPSLAQVMQLDAGLAQLAAWIGANQVLSILQHPYWSKLAGCASSERIVYDCLDHQAGFADNSESILAEENELLRSADLVVATSQWLKDELVADNRHVALIRNAGEFELFSCRPDTLFADPAGRRVIGYYGAIEAWFDLALVRAVAQRFPQHLVLLIGKDMIGASKALADLPNVHCNPEVKYTELPSWLYGFDVCLMPFRVLPLTLATNPVKIYEYLGAGKPVVAVDLPEMAQFGDLIRTASTYPAFLEAIAETLDGHEDPSLPARRQVFAAGQTWEHRVDQLEAEIAAIRLPRVSVIVVTYGNLYFTRNCLDSLLRHSNWADLEVIVVDNGSQDGTPEFLQSWRDQGASRHIVLNAENRGFAAANNQGLAVATGEYLILLNNDTFVTRGWVRGLLTHLRSDDGIGMVGPVTNNIGNEARIEINYSDMEEMADESRRYTTLHRGRSFGIPTLAFFCVAMPRATYDKVGPLDEAFGIGFFEDDDYCRRIEQVGLRVACAEDVYVHHHLSASFDQLRQEDRQALFERNKLIYESKWGPWRPHTYR